MDTFLLIVSALVILWLLVKAATLRAELRGVERTLGQMNTGNYNGGGGCLVPLAIVGLLALCALCFYVGLVAAGGVN